MRSIAGELIDDSLIRCNEVDFQSISHLHEDRAQVKRRSMCVALEDQSRHLELVGLELFELFIDTHKEVLTQKRAFSLRDDRVIRGGDVEHHDVLISAPEFLLHPVRHERPCCRS